VGSQGGLSGHRDDEEVAAAGDMDGQDDDNNIANGMDEDEEDIDEDEVIDVAEQIFVKIAE